MGTVNRNLLVTRGKSSMRHLVSILSLCTVAILTLAFGSGLHAQLYGLQQGNPVSSGYYGSNGGTYNMGWSFRVNVDGMMVTHLGCNRPSNGANTGQLWDLSTNQVVATASIQNSVGQWTFSQLTTPVALVNGRNYLVSAYGSGYYYGGTMSGAWTPSGDITYITSLYNTSTSSVPNSNLGNHYGIADFGYTKGPNITGTAVAGTAQTVYADFQGPNNGGFEVGTFDLTNNATAGGQLNSIEISADTGSTANVATDLVDISLYRDDPMAGTQGSWDSMDTQIDTAKTFSSATAAVTFNTAGTEGMFGVSEVKDYFIVIRLSGTATPTETIDFNISDLNVTAPTGATLPTTPVTMAGVVIRTPDFVVSDVSPPNPQTAYLGVGDNVQQAIQIAYPAGPVNSLSTLTIQGDGTGDEVADLTAVQLFRDSNNNNLFDPGVDVQASNGPAVFSNDNGNAIFSIAPSQQSFNPGDVRLYFVVYQFNLMASDGDTFQTRVSAATAGLPGTNFAGVPAPQAGTGYLGGDFASGSVITGFGLIFFYNGPDTISVVDNDATGTMGEGELLLDFTVFAINENWTMSDINFRASGTGNDGLAYADLALYEDVNANGRFDGPGTDTLATNGLGAFASDNGLYTATLANPATAANTNRRFFLYGNLAGTASYGDTFFAEVESAVATTAGVGQIVNLPTQASNALEIDEGRLIVTMIGPTAANPINANSVGSLGYGEVLADFTVECKNDAYTVNSIDLKASGTGDDARDLQSLTLYEDTNGNGAFDGASVDQRATAMGASAFSIDNGVYQAVLGNQQLTLNQTRRFFLLASFGGTARADETFTVTVSAINATPVVGGTISGVPTMTSAGVIIAPSAVTVRNSPFAPSGTTLFAGTAQTHVLGAFRMEASNDTATINGFTLTLNGTGTWNLDLAQSNGVQVWLDDGNGSFDAAADELLFSGTGQAPSIPCLFSMPLIVPNSTFVDFFVVINILPSAGGSIPDTFSASIAQTLDVNAGAGTAVARGMPEPVTGTVNVLDFRVTTISPLSDFVEGESPMTLVGSGLLKVTALRIGGIPCGGTPVHAADGTSITGFRVPRGKGSGLAIELTTDYLGTITLNQKFNYLGARPITGGGSSSVSVGTCAQNEFGGNLWLLLAPLAAMALFLRRREA